MNKNLSQQNNKNLDRLDDKKAFDRRQFYNNDDSGKVFIFSILLPYILSFIISIIISIAVKGDAEVVKRISDSPIFLVLSSLCGPAAFAIIFFAYTKMFKISFSASTINNKISLKSALVSIAVAPLSFLGLYLFINCHDQLLRVIGFGLNDMFDKLPMSNGGWLCLYIIVFAILPALFEEFVFRGMILQGLRTNFSDRFAICLTAVMFALMHGSLQQFVYPLLMGLILSWIALRTGSVWCSFIVHGINNAIVVVLAFLSARGIVFAPFQNVWWYYLVAFVALILTFVAIYLLDKFVFKGKNESDIQKQPVQRASLFLWFGIGLAALLFALNLLMSFLGKA